MKPLTYCRHISASAVTGDDLDRVVALLESNGAKVTSASQDGVVFGEGSSGAFRFLNKGAVSFLPVGNRTQAKVQLWVGRLFLVYLLPGAVLSFVLVAVHFPMLILAVPFLLVAGLAGQLFVTTSILNTVLSTIRGQCASKP